MEATERLELYRGEKKKKEFESKIFSCFDRPEDSFRFDRTKTRVFPEVLDADPNRPPPKEPKGFEGKGFFRPNTQRTTGGEYASVGKYCYWHALGGRQAVISNIDSRQYVIVDAFDVRDICLAFKPDWEKRTPLETLLQQWSAEDYRLTNEGQNVYRIEHVEKERRHALWVDKARSFVPVRMEYCNRPIDKPGVLPKWIEQSFIELTWEKFDDVWVPLTYIRTHVLVSNDDWIANTERTKIEFRWKDVNRPVDVRHFTFEDFNLPNGTRIIDATLGHAITIRVVGEP